MTDASMVGYAITQGGHEADGGVESISQIIDRLEDVSAVVLTNEESQCNKRWRDAGATVLVKKSLWRPWRSPNRRRAAGRVLQLAQLIASNLQAGRLFRRASLSVVHFNDIYAMVGMGLGARLAGSTVVFNVRNLPQGPSARIHWRWACAISHSIVLLSNDMAQQFPKLVKSRRIERKLRTIRSGVDVDKLRASAGSGRAHWKKRLLTDPTDVAIGYIGRCCERKQQLPFIKNVLPLLADDDTWHLYFIGDFDPATDPYARECQAALSALDLTHRVTVVGPTDRIYDWYQALDLVVLTSQLEGLARAMIESVASGTPVISFEVCSAREILEEYDCGIVIPQGDYEGFAAATRQLLRDETLRVNLGSSGERCGSQLFDPTITARAYGSLYRSLGRTG